jgi:large subunit ribosomal protein L28
LKLNLLFCALFEKRIPIKHKDMSKVCQITGKTFMVGNNVSHSKRRTKRRFEVNLFYKKFFLPVEQRWVDLRISAAGLRLVNKLGIEAALKDAKANGFINKY